MCGSRRAAQHVAGGVGVAGGEQLFGHQKHQVPVVGIAVEADPDLVVATRIAVQEMVDFLARTRGLTRHQAYQLVSVAGHVAVTQLVDKPTMGVHVKVPKSLFK